MPIIRTLTCCLWKRKL